MSLPDIPPGESNAQKCPSKQRNPHQGSCLVLAAWRHMPYKHSHQDHSWVLILPLYTSVKDERLPTTDEGYQSNLRDSAIKHTVAAKDYQVVQNSQVRGCERWTTILWTPQCSPKFIISVRTGFYCCATI